MKIRHIRIDGFGRFAGNEYGPLERPVTVFHGPNEAGKSTLLEFIRTVLFGFRPRAGRPPREGWPNDYAPLAGGRHGGRVTLVNEHGQHSMVERFAGGRIGRIAVTVGASVAQDEAVLAQLLGNHSRAVFERIFAFTLDELYSEDLLNDENVNSQIYSAGMGVTSLPNAIKSIDSARKDIFLKGGSSQKMYDVCTKIEDIDRRLRQIADNAAAFGNLTVRLKKIHTQINELTTRRHQLQARLNHRVRLQNAWDPWNDLLTAKGELEKLPVIDRFPAKGIGRMETLQERIQHVRREHESACVRLADAQSRVDAPIEHEPILAHLAKIRRIERGRTSFDDSVHDLPEREAELNGNERALAETLKDLGLDWDEDRVEAFDVSIAVREEISQHQIHLRETSRELDQCKAALTQARAALAEAAEAENRAKQERDAATKPNLDQEQARKQRALIRTAGSRLRQMQSVEERVSVLRGQLDRLAATVVPLQRTTSSKAVGGVGILVGISFLVGGTILGGHALVVGIVAALAIVAFAAYVLTTGTSSPSSGTEVPLASSLRDAVRHAEADLTEIRSGLEQDAAKLGVETIDEASLIAAEGSLDDEEASIRAWINLSESLERAGELTQRRKGRLEQSLKSVEESNGQLEAFQQQWQEWLRVRGLRDTFGPEAVVELRSKVEVGLTQLREVRSWRQRVRAIQRDIDEYIEIVAPLASAFEIPVDRNDPKSVAGAADRLVQLLDKVKSGIRDRTDAEVELREANRELEGRKSDLGKAEEELKQLFQSGDAEDAEDFRVRADLFERRTELDEHVRTALHQLQRVSGPGEPLESLKTDLSRTDAQSIADEAKRLEEEQKMVDSEIGELSTERGSVQAELQRLAGEEESSRLRMDRQILCEQARGHARDWSRLSLAQNLLEEARRKFERERQPGVVRHAQEFFAGITGDRYRQVYAPLGEQTITVADADGRTKRPSELSRGTREQLFLSLRFGLIRELGQRTEPLPVVVDEVLVNFDPKRALRAAVAFVELSYTNQVLVFTCQPAVVKLFRRATAAAGVEAPEEIQIT